VSAYDIATVFFVIGLALLIYVMSATKDPQ